MVGAPAVEIARAVREGRISARAVVESHLDQIARLDGELGAFQLVRREKALREAEELDQRADLNSLALSGVPVAIKDNIDIAGEPTRNGSAASDAAPRGTDHEVVRRLRAAGAIPLGKTRAPELCVWGRTDGAFGVSRNPWNRERTSGGSSGGSAAAVASRLVPIAHASDGMGSIRIPAAVCGIFGLKPGPGVVPADIGVSSWFGMSENGPLANTVADAAVMLAVMAGDPGLASTPDPSGLRIALATKAPVAGVRVQRRFRQAARDTAAVLGGLGHQVVERDPPYSLRIVLPLAARWGCGTAEEAEQLDRGLLEKRTRRHARMGRLLRRIGQMDEGSRDRWCDDMDAFFEEADLLITPALAATPPRAEGWSKRSWIKNVWIDANYAPFSAAWNFARLPAATVPVGVGETGLPVAIQLVAPRGQESLLLGVAAQLEREQPWRMRPASGAPSEPELGVRRG